MEYYAENGDFGNKFNGSDVEKNFKEKGISSLEETVIVPAEKKHWYSITAMTEAFFPYANFSYDEIMRRLGTDTIFYFVALAGSNSPHEPDSSEGVEGSRSGHTVGFVDFELKQKSAQILGLAVLEEYRGKGIGTKLLQKALDEIMRLASERVTPLERIDLLVSDSNPAALALYRKHDFVSAGKLDHKLWGQDIMVYSKKLFEGPQT